jgi:hypothetical protein
MEAERLPVTVRGGQGEMGVYSIRGLAAALSRGFAGRDEVSPIQNRDAS